MSETRIELDEGETLVSVGWDEAIRSGWIVRTLLRLGHDPRWVLMMEPIATGLRCHYFNHHVDLTKAQINDLGNKL